MEFSREDTRALTRHDDQTVQMWEVAPAKFIRLFPQSDFSYGTRFNGDGSRVLTWSGKQAQLWDVQTEAALQTFPHDDVVFGASFSADESRLLTWGQDRTVRHWYATGGELIQTFTHFGSVSDVNFSGDESRLLSRSENQVILWDATTPAPMRTFKENGSAQFSRDGTNVLTWSNDNTARLWDATTAAMLKTFPHKDWVNGAQFSHNESQVLTWSDDKTAQLWDKAQIWDVSQANPLQTFKHDSTVLGAQFSRDGLKLLTWCEGGAVRVWDCSDTLATLEPAERIAELEVRNWVELDSTNNARLLSLDEWQTKARSAEYAKAKEKLAARKVGAGR